jgi:hypothetical protein
VLVSSVEEVDLQKRRLSSQMNTPALSRSIQASSQDSYFPKSPQPPQWNSQYLGAGCGIKRASSTRLEEARGKTGVGDCKIPRHSNDEFIGMKRNKSLDLNDDQHSQMGSKGSSVNGQDDEDLQPNPRMSMRMLQDGKGRLCKLLMLKELSLP